MFADQGSQNRAQLSMVLPRRFGMIVRRHPATTGEFHWHVPLDFPCHEYLKLTVTDCDNEDAEDQSSVFMILAGPPRERLATHPDLRMSRMRSGATQNDAPIDLPPDLPPPSSGARSMGPDPGHV